MIFIIIHQTSRLTYFILHFFQDSRNDEASQLCRYFMSLLSYKIYAVQRLYCIFLKGKWHVFRVDAPQPKTGGAQSLSNFRDPCLRHTVQHSNHGRSSRGRRLGRKWQMLTRDLFVVANLLVIDFSEILLYRDVCDALQLKNSAVEMGVPRLAAKKHLDSASSLNDTPRRRLVETSQ